MRHQVKLPRMGDTTQVVVVNEWLVEAGAVVQAGQGLLAVETDKVTAEVPAPVAGRLTEQLVKAQDEVAVGAVIAIIES